MIIRMFALKDSKIGLFMNPMFLNSRGQALRVLTDEINRKVPPGGQEQETVLQTHPEDCELYEIGEYDTESGVVSSTGAPILVASCKDLVVGRS